MNTKTLALTSVRALALDQVLGWLDRLIFYPLLLWSAIKFGWLFCFLITLPFYFVYSVIIVTIHHRYMADYGIDVFGIHTLQGVARKTKPPSFFKRSTFQYLIKRLKLIWISTFDRHHYRVTAHIFSRFIETVSKKILSWILVNKFLLYVVGTLVILDPQSVFMYTQKCESENDFVKKIMFKLSLMVCWHIFFWSWVAFGVVSGVKWFVWLWG